MSLKLVLALFALNIKSFAFSQASTQLKRTPYKLSVAVDKKTVYEEEINATYYVLPNNTIQLYPGETIHVEIEQKDGVISAVTAVAEVANPEKTITISFKQNTKKKVHEMTILQIVNPFPQDIVYRSKIFLLKQNRWVDTKVIPVRAKLSAFETWPDIITSIAIGGWEFR